MKLKQVLAVNFQTTKASAALLILRFVAGTAFMMHGWPKIQNPMTWAGPDAKIPGALLLLAAVSEFFGGLSWILGLLTPISSFGIAITMAVATSMHAFVLSDSFVAAPGKSSFEPALVYLVVALVLMLVGPGKFSADHQIFSKKS